MELFKGTIKRVFGGAVLGTDERRICTYCLPRIGEQFRFFTEATGELSEELITTTRVTSITDMQWDGDAAGRRISFGTKNGSLYSFEVTA